MPSSKKNLTMLDIAKVAGCSTATVSLALSNSPRIPDEKRQKIKRIAKKLGYRPDPHITELMKYLRTLSRRKAHATIGVLIPEIPREKVPDYPLIKQMIIGIRDVAESVGFNIDIFHLSEDGMTPRRIRNILIARGIRGVIVIPFMCGVAKLDFDFTGFFPGTIGYSIIEPRMHRACANYLQGMNDLLAEITAYGYKRPALAMTYSQGGVGHKLLVSSFLYFQNELPPENRIPILPKPEITPTSLQTWINQYRPDVIISEPLTYQMLNTLGYQIPRDMGFASLDIFSPWHAPENIDLSGVDFMYNLVGEEVMKIVLSSLKLNIAGIPRFPKTVLAHSHLHRGSTLIPQAPQLKKNNRGGGGQNPKRHK